MKLFIKQLMGLLVLSALNVQNVLAYETHQALALEFVNIPIMPLNAQGTSLTILSIKNNVHDQNFNFTVTPSQNNAQYAALQVMPLENNANACESVGSQLNSFKINANKTCNIGLYIVSTGIESVQTLQDRLTIDYGGITFPYLDIKYITELAPVFVPANGPDSGVINSVVVQNSSVHSTAKTFYAGGAGGVFASTDNGGHWTELNTGFPINTNVTALTISDDNVLYAATANDAENQPARIYQLINNEWEEIASNTDSDFVGIVSLWVSPENHLLAGSAAGLFWWDGKFWTQVVDDLMISSIITNPAGGAFVGAQNADATTDNTGVFTWDEDKFKQISQTGGSSILSLIYDSNNATLYAGGNELHLWAENTWQPINSCGDIAGITGLTLDTHNNLYIAANFSGVYKYTEQACTQINDDLPKYAQRGFNGLVRDAQNLYVYYSFPWSGGFGVYKTDLNTISWGPTNTGLIQTSINDLAIDSNDQVYAASSLSGPFQMDTHSWTAMRSDALYPVSTKLVAIGEDKNSLYITNLNAQFIDTIFHWDETQSNWVALVFHPTPRPPISRINATIVHDGKLYIGSINGLYQWDGHTLKAISNSQSHNISSFAIDTSVSPNILYVGVRNGIGTAGIYTLTLNADVSDFKNIPQTETANVLDLALFTPANDQSIVYAILDTPGVWTWDGSEWTDIPSLSEYQVTDLAVDSVGTLYSSGKLNLSNATNLGVFITPFQQGTYFVTDDLYITEVLDIAIDSSNKVYVGTNGSGVYTLF